MSQRQSGRGPQRPRARVLDRDELRFEIENMLRQLLAEALSAGFGGPPPDPTKVAEQITTLAVGPRRQRP